MKKPELWFAEIVMRCPDGERSILLPATSGAAALKRGLQFKREDARQAFMRQRCVKVGVRILPRGAGAGLAGGKKRRRKRKKSLGQGVLPAMIPFGRRR